MYEAAANHADDLGLSQMVVTVTEKSRWILRSPQHHLTVSLAFFVLDFAGYSAFSGRGVRRSSPTVRAVLAAALPVGTPLFPNSLTRADPLCSTDG